MAFYNYIFVFVVFFLMNGGIMKPVVAQQIATKDDDILKTVLQELKVIKNELNNCKSSNSKLQDEVKRLKDEIDRLHVKHRIQLKMITEQKRDNKDTPSCYNTQSPSRVAFTAYLDHHMTHLGDNQAIVYNKILLNAGEAYNIHNGMFTAPISGVYIFSWSCTARRTGSSFDIWVTLVVNSATQTTAVAESQSTYYDHQGSSTVIIHVNKGDIVWTKRLSSGGAEIHSETERRVSSFTGALLSSDASLT
ncbi:complement C1q-like protein 4 [Mercenaria mercenaria]|uniref:complement C1q-like protein 4 n=1 Tax=Mercenaria mercenaria TaxID=6596 RepID=UPI00234ED5F0|nr:complement C1q-like protein 4 [Mercenaria mercenaria]